MDTRLINAYSAARAQGYRAQSALSVARNAAGKIYHPVTRATLGAAFEHCGRTCRTLDGNPSALGLRVWNADEVARIEHNGWYSRADDYSATYVGVVLLLRAPDGWRAFAGYRDSDSDCIVIDMAPCDMLERASLNTNRGEDLRNAGRAADQFAERAAEESREHDAAWQAGAAYADELADAKALRTKMRAVLRGLQHCTIGSPEVCDTLRASLRGMRRNIADCLKRARSLKEGNGATPKDHWRQFWTGSATLRDAFNDGAGSTVLT